MSKKFYELKEKRDELFEEYEKLQITDQKKATEKLEEWKLITDIIFDFHSQVQKNLLNNFYNLITKKNE
jgi:hypothetical protein